MRNIINGVISCTLGCSEYSILVFPSIYENWKAIFTDFLYLMVYRFSTKIVKYCCSCRTIKSYMGACLKLIVTLMLQILTDDILPSIRDLCRFICKLLLNLAVWYECIWCYCIMRGILSTLCIQSYSKQNDGRITKISNTFEWMYCSITSISLSIVFILNSKVGIYCYYN